MSQALPRHRLTLQHVAFWVLFATVFLVQLSFGRREGPDWETIVPDVLFHTAMLLVLSYLNYFVFLPRLLAGGSVGRYLLSYGPIFVVLTYLTITGKRYLIDGFTHTHHYIYSLRFTLNTVVTAVVVTVFVALLRLAENYFALEAKSRELQNQQLRSELRFLKAQVNPHFLFNTLNNLYYLAVNQSEQTPEVIAKLSEMMRYMIHESATETVPLSREVAYMENYLDLERLRMNEEVPITFEVEGNLDAVRITPLILITFLENAFKHGIGNGRTDSWITVSLQVTDGRLQYRVANSRVGEADKTVREASGIGLANVHRRLDLSYPGRHTLTVTEDETSYRVFLEIEYA